MNGTHVTGSQAMRVAVACVGPHSRLQSANAEVVRQSRDDAWWTGPILAAGASTLPQGHTLIEPYVFNVRSRGRYDDNGTRQPSPRRDSYGSLTYMLYGVADGFTAGVIPRFGYNDLRNGPDSSRRRRRRLHDPGHVSTHAVQGGLVDPHDVHRAAGDVAHRKIRSPRCTPE